jgi:UDP-N-acetylglucosamine diphosphorylase/glucosamine-1-phosphate N-acetyltransferase
MSVWVFEDQMVPQLEPLTLTRPAFDLWCGGATLLERHRRYFGIESLHALVRPFLVDFCRLTHPDLAASGLSRPPEGATVLVNARWLPPPGKSPLLGEPRTGLVGDHIAYVVLPSHQPTTNSPGDLEEYLEACKRTLPRVAAGGWMVNYLWDLIEHNGPMLREDFPEGPCQKGCACEKPRLTVVGPSHRLFVDPAARVEPFAVADTTRGPVVIERKAVVQAFSRLEGPCYVGMGSWVLGARVRGSTIGPFCRVGGEVEASILQGHSNKAHDGFLGHSYLGEWVNLAAGTQVSNLRNDYGPIRMIINGKLVDTGLTKVGAYLGDHTKVGLGVFLNTGTSVGVFGNLLPAGQLLPRSIPSFAMFWHGQLQGRSDWRQMLETARTAMHRRGHKLTETHVELFNAVYEQTAEQRAQAVWASEQRRLRRSIFPLH